VEFAQYLTKTISDNKTYFDALKKVFPNLAEADLIAIWCAHSLPGGWRKLTPEEESAYQKGKKTIIVEGKKRKVFRAYTGDLVVTTCIQDQVYAKIYYMQRYSDLAKETIFQLMDQGFLGTGSNDSPVGGVTWQDAQSEKAKGSKDFQFKNIPAVGEIKSMGFRIDTMQSSTISELIK
jgi:hypothetical protein